MEYGISTLAQGLVAAWALVAVAFVALGILVYVAIGGLTRPATLKQTDLEKAVAAFRSLDIDAFRNLVDSSEEQFLRSNLAPSKFREIKRQRAWAAFIYAWEAGKAAAALATVAQAAQRSPDPRIAASGAQVAENAFRLRLHTIQVGVRLLTEVALPDLQSRSLPAFLDQYERTSQTLFRLGGFSSANRGLASSESA
ncbi:MAG: hypothetical protein WAK29_20070 [Terriglobales bacterium]